MLFVCYDVFLFLIVSRLPEKHATSLILSRLEAPEDIGAQKRFCGKAENDVNEFGSVERIEAKNVAAEAVDPEADKEDEGQEKRSINEIRHRTVRTR